MRKRRLFACRECKPLDFVKILALSKINLLEKKMVAIAEIFLILPLHDVTAHDKSILL